MFSFVRSSFECIVKYRYYFIYVNELDFYCKKKKYKILFFLFNRDEKSFIFVLLVIMLLIYNFLLSNIEVILYLF